MQKSGAMENGTLEQWAILSLRSNLYYSIVQEVLSQYQIQDTHFAPVAQMDRASAF